MHNTRKINKDLYYIGCSDRRLQLFESAYPIPNGVSYNSYLLTDDKTALFDTVDKHCAEQFLENLAYALNGKDLDYLIVQHMEPDHASLIKRITELYPDVKILCTAKAKDMINQFFEFDTEKYVNVVKEGDTLNTGRHELTFITAPMVHWPEVMVTYDKTDKALFSADAFGAFGAINGNLYDDEINLSETYINESRRYYSNIVGKYGAQVMMLLNKASGVEINTIYPLHGLILRTHIGDFIELYKKWATYTPEEKGVVIAFSSVYGGTENAIDILANKLAQKGVKNIKLFDVSFTHPSYVLAEMFKYSNAVIATTTYNMGIFESMETFLNILVAHNLKNRKFSIIQNGSWAPACGNLIRLKLGELKNSEIIGEDICIKSTLKEEQLNKIEELATTIANEVLV